MHAWRNSGALCALCLLIAASSAYAKPKEKTYPKSCEQVWTAVKTVTSGAHYNFADFNDAEKKAIISTGNNLTGKRYLDITLKAPTADSCTVAIGGQFSGFAHNDKGDLFSRIEEAMNPATATASSAGQNPKP